MKLNQRGDKILLPPSAFDVLARLQVDYPMLFQLRTGGADPRETHCGVLEFTAEEGCVYIPFWMMQNLLIEEGSLITVTNGTFPVLGAVEENVSMICSLSRRSNIHPPLFFLFAMTPRD